jgi:hypothetical protein
MIDRIVLLSALLCYPALGKEYTAYLGGRSIHFNGDKGEDYNNETHNLLAIGYKGLTIGALKNSYDDQTYFAGYDLKQNNVYLTYGAVLGASYGYCGKNQKTIYKANYGCHTNRWLPLGVAYLSYSEHPIQPTVGLTWDAIIFTIRVEL